MADLNSHKKHPSHFHLTEHDWKNVIGPIVGFFFLFNLLFGLFVYFLSKPISDFLDKWEQWFIFKSVVDTILTLGIGWLGFYITNNYHDDPLLLLFSLSYSIFFFFVTIISEYKLDFTPSIICIGLSVTLFLSLKWVARITLGVLVGGFTFVLFCVQNYLLKINNSQSSRTREPQTDQEPSSHGGNTSRPEEARVPSTSSNITEGGSSSLEAGRDLPISRARNWFPEEGSHLPISRANSCPRNF